jgi:hypothetical protein
MIYPIFRYQDYCYLYCKRVKSRLLSCCSLLLYENAPQTRRVERWRKALSEEKGCANRAYKKGAASRKALRAYKKGAASPTGEGKPLVKPSGHTRKAEPLR